MNKRSQEELGAAILFGIVILLILVVLSMPITGTIFGETVTLPIIGWIAFAVFAVIALYLFFKHRA